MNAPLEFCFNQSELQLLSNKIQSNKIVISFCNIIHVTKGEMYLCAQSADQNNIPNQAFDVIVACPKPPAWQSAGLRKIQHSELLHSPKFAVDGNALSAVFANNQFEMVDSSTGIIIKQVVVALEGRFTNGLDLETFITIKILDKQGNPVKPPIDAVAI
jgi:hypothetical protein